MTPERIARFWSYTEPEPNTGCFLWTKFTNPLGYGMFGVEGGKVRLAHRIAWQITNGPIPTGLLVLHRCDVPSCVNPDHLWLGTDADNCADRDRKGRGAQAKKTHCPHGHEYTPENTYRATYAGPWGRSCRECRRIHSHESWLVRKASLAVALATA